MQTCGRMPVFRTDPPQLTKIQPEKGSSCETGAALFGSIIKTAGLFTAYLYQHVSEFLS